MALDSDYAFIRRDPDVLAAARAVNLNEADLDARIRAEADGLATWAALNPAAGAGSAGGSTWAIRVDRAAMLAANFVVSV